MRKQVKTFSTAEDAESAEEKREWISMKLAGKLWMRR